MEWTPEACRGFLFKKCKVMNKVNYINHHKNVHAKMMELDLTAIDIAVYNALFLIWNASGFRETISINRTEVMYLSKIGNVTTYTKSLKRLSDNKIIDYLPSKNPLKGSKVTMYRCDTCSVTSSGHSGVPSSAPSSVSSSVPSSATLHKPNKLLKLIKLFKLFKQRFSKFKFDKFISFVLENIKTDEDLEKLMSNFNNTNSSTEPTGLDPEDLFDGYEKPNSEYDLIKIKNIEMCREISKDISWVEDFSMKNKIHNDGKYSNFRIILLEFASELSLSEKTHKTKSEFKMHFSNWAKLKKPEELTAIVRKFERKVREKNDDNKSTAKKSSIVL